MNCSIPVLKINTSDCVGDSLGKHNYNAIALDTTLCNLSSLFYKENGLQQAISSLNTVVSYYNDIIQYINIQKLTDDVKIASTTVNILSSYWNNYEFSISLPINAVSLTENDLTLLLPTLSTVNIKNINSVVDSTLKTMVNSELSVNYPAVNYPDYTIINVSCFLYNLVPIISDDNIDPLVKIKYEPTNSFSYNKRIIQATYSRDNVHFSTGIILRYYVNNNKWNYIGYIINENVSTAEPNHNIPAIELTPLSPIINSNTNINHISECNSIIQNRWYPVDTYVYSNALCTGTSTRSGTVTLTFRTPDNQTSVYNYKATGYNPSTNRGGYDIYLEFDGESINAYEQYPTPKALMKSWTYPYKGRTGINFKYTYDGKGVKLNLCASTAIIPLTGIPE
jgi:hypothetical protein